MTASEMISGRIFDTFAEVELVGRRHAVRYGTVWAAAGRLWTLYEDQAIEIEHVRQHTYRERKD